MFYGELHHYFHGIFYDELHHYSIQRYGYPIIEV
jgi:hypothetical protein